ncbi:S-adenosyl-L-methionine-dependent methyltransferase [Microthyrium microscopicum]|uniref:S-adenosyl-L-methionine-dependent methyltransferase n=1 Tax=Microthyrium microscopicum TaxID=703497 RepID=A0A6A6UAI4_9PEZI|nr:S-adenosyl-L-methionine-dependent methyltransferase [Microthyrium microscopicum]
METQHEVAKRMYNARASKYNDSWHPSFAAYVVSYLDPQPGWDILDLACGTGLVTFNAAKAVGPTGSVTAIDVSDGMLYEAKKELTRLQNEEGGWNNIQIFNHDITNLAQLDAIRDRKFDAITCASCLVLLDSPYDAVSSWASLLKPGGELVTDVTHPSNQPFGIALEVVYARLGLQPPSQRMWSQSADDIQRLFEAAGLEVQDVHLQTQAKYGEKKSRADDGGKLWDDYAEAEVTRPLQDEKIKDRAREMFLEEWRLLADKEGNVIDMDGVFIGKGLRKDEMAPKAAMLGSCACGHVTWKAAIAPLSICHCCCVPCRKISGGPFLTMMEFDSWAVSFTPRLSDLQQTNLSPHARRGFCGRCGTTLWYQQFRSLNRIEIAMGSLDEETLNGVALDKLLKNTRKHWTQTKSKVSWWDIPDDGWAKYEGMSNQVTEDAMHVYK